MVPITKLQLANGYYKLLDMLHNVDTTVTLKKVTPYADVLCEQYVAHQMFSKAMKVLQKVMDTRTRLFKLDMQELLER